LQNNFNSAHLYLQDAITTLDLALKYAPENPAIFFTMGNVHATLMQFNNSAQSYADALKIQPQFDAAKSRRHAVLCHHKLEQALEEQHRYLVIKFGSNVCYMPIFIKFQKDYQFFGGSAVYLVMSFLSLYLPWCTRYYTHSIITRGLYIYYPILKSISFFQRGFFRKFCPYVWLVFKSGLYWCGYGI
jgi:hypothetical protein